MKIKLYFPRVLGLADYALEFMHKIESIKSYRYLKLIKFSFIFKQSLGVILYILVCGSFPFPGESLGDIRSQVLRGLVRFPFFLSSACEQVIRGMLQVEPSKRLRLEQVTATPWMQASPNLAHYTNLLAQYTSKARQQHADVLLQKQFPEHSSVITTTRCQRQMESLDGGLIRALALATGANEEEIRKSTAQKSFDRLHAGYALLVDKIARFAANAKLREVVEIWIKNSGMSAANLPGSLSSETKKMSILWTPDGGDDGRPTTSKLMSWREEVEEENDESGFEVIFRQNLQHLTLTPILTLQPIH